MRLKIVTTAFLVAILALLLASPVALGPVPKKSAPREVKRQYGVRTLTYLAVLLVAFTGSGVGSYLIIKNAREEYREASLNNLKTLLEGAAKDAKNNPNESDQA